MTGPYSPISASFSAAAHADERASEAFPADGEALSEQLRRGVYGSLAGRLMAESPVAEVAHLVLAGMASVLVFPWVPRLQVVLWASSIAVAALARRRLRAAEHLLAESPEKVLRRVRVGVALLGLAWGLGALLLGPALPAEPLGWLTVLFAGLCAGATVSLLADPPSFYLLITLLLSGVSGGVALNENMNSQTLGVLMIAFFGGTVTVLQRRAHAALVKQLMMAKRLELTERAARRERLLLDALITGAPSAISVVDDEGRVLRVNRGFESVFGYPAADAVGRQIDELLVPREEEAGSLEIASRIRAGETVVKEAQRRRRDGTPLTVRLAAAPVLADGIRMAFILYDDVTEARRTRDTSERLARILEATPDPVCIAEPDGRLRYLNGAGRRLLGMGPDQSLSGLTMFRLLPPRLRGEIAGMHIPAVMRDGSWTGESALLPPGWPRHSRVFGCAAA